MASPRYRVVCPNNREHNVFEVVAHVTEDWLVDRDNNFIEVSSGNETTAVHRPDSHDMYLCRECSREEGVVIALIEWYT